MDHLNDLLNDYEKGRIDRRRLLQMAGLTAAALTGGGVTHVVHALAQSAGGANKAFPVTTVNHLSIGLPDYVASRNFYVDLFGMRDVWDDGKKCQVDCGNPSAPNSLYLVQGQPTAKATV